MITIIVHMIYQAIIANKYKLKVTLLSKSLLKRMIDEQTDK